MSQTKIRRPSMTYRKTNDPNRKTFEVVGETGIVIAEFEKRQSCLEFIEHVKRFPAGASHA